MLNFEFTVHDTALKSVSLRPSSRRLRRAGAGRPPHPTIVRSLRRALLTGSGDPTLISRPRCSTNRTSRFRHEGSRMGRSSCCSADRCSAFIFHPALHDKGRGVATYNFRHMDQPSILVKNLSTGTCRHLVNPFNGHPSAGVLRPRCPEELKDESPPSRVHITKVGPHAAHGRPRLLSAGDCQGDRFDTIKRPGHVLTLQNSA